MKLATFFFGKAAYLLDSVLIVLIISYFSASPPLENHTSVAKERLICQTVRVIDGDSVKAICPPYSKPLSLRLENIDAPESKQLPWGEAAKVALADLLGQEFIAVLNGRDIYNRHLATLYTMDKQSVALALLQAGHVRVYRRYHPPGKYLQAMQTAKRKKRGIWQQSGLQQDPQRWRRLMQ